MRKTHPYFQKESTKPKKRNLKEPPKSKRKRKRVKGKGNYERELLHDLKR